MKNFIRILLAIPLLLIACNDKIEAKLDSEFTTLEFSIDKNERLFEITNRGEMNLEWSLVTSASWINCSENSGNLEGGKSLVITVSLDRSKFETFGNDVNSPLQLHEVIYITSNGGSMALSIIVDYKKDRIYYLSSPNFNENVLVASSIGNSKKEYLLRGEIMNFRLSSSGENIVITEVDESRHSLISNYNLITRSKEIIHSEGNYNSHPCWSPDEKEIVFVKYDTIFWRYNLYKIKKNGDGIHNLTGALNGWSNYPVYTSDGEKIIFSYQDITDGDYEIAIMNIDGSGFELLTNNDFDDFDADISPDGTKIIFTSIRDRARDLFIMNVDGTNEQPLIDYGYSARFNLSGEILFSSYKDIQISDEFGEDKSGVGHFTNIEGSSLLDW